MTPAGHATAGAAHAGWRVFRVTSLGVLLTFLNSSTLNVALPGVVRHFGAGATAGSWILLTYMLFNTVFVLLFGRLGDLFGRRRLYVAGLALFIAASLGCALAPDVGTLIVLRALQGIGAAAVITNTTALLTDAFPARLLSTGLGLNTTIAAASQVMGPVVGGALVTWLGWQSVFLFNLPFGLVALALAVRLPAGQTVRGGERFDWLGSALFMAALGALLFVLSTGGARGWTSPLCLAGMAVAAVAGPGFVLSQLSRSDPLVDLGLFADPARRAGYLCAVAVAAANNGTVLVVALFLRAVQGLDAFAAGWRVMIVAGGMMLMAPAAGRLARQVPHWKLGAIGLLLMLAGLTGLTGLLSAHMTTSGLAVMLLLIGLGYGTFMTPNTAAIMASVAPERRGIANGLRSTLLNSGTVLGSAAGLAIATSLLSVDGKDAVYGTALAGLPAAEVGRLVLGFRLSLGVFAVAIAAAILLLLRLGALPRDRAAAA
jgi:EmrB/QacA subfamily drug resistance transporter